MHKHNNNPTNYPVKSDSIQSITDQQSATKPLKPLKTRNLFQLVVFSLAFLLTTALILVGGSFSKNTSKGEISISSLNILTATEFEVIFEESTDYELGDAYSDGDDNKMLLVLYAFTILNSSELNITYDMELNINEISGFDEIEDLTFYLYDVDNTQNAITYFNKDNIDNSNDLLFKYSTKNDLEWETVFLDTDSSKTYVLVVDCCNYNGADNIDISISGTITVTVNQVKEEL